MTQLSPMNDAGRLLLSATTIVLLQGLVAIGAVKVGFSERDITPEIGMEQPGGYGKAFHRAFHDPCKVRACVFDDGKRRAAIVGLDALVIRRPSVLRCREQIEARCGIAAGDVMIAASHSHSSGPTGMILPGEYDDASSFVQKLAYERSSMANADYLERVESAIVEAVCAANDARSEARCGFGSGVEDQVAFNRRFRMRNGYSYTHPGQGNPDIIEPAGPTDPEVGVVGVWDTKGRLLGCIVNYACHATTNPGGISANYIYYLEQVVRGVMGSEVIVVFTAGAAGDVTQVNNLSPERQRVSEDSARFVGGRIGAEVVKVLFSVARSGEVPVDVRSNVLKIHRRVPRSDRVAQSMKLVESPPKNADGTQITFAKEIVLLDARIRHDPVADVEVQAIQLGPAVFVSNPAEYFCQYGLDIKKGSRFPLTYPVSVANGAVGYVPTEEALGPRGGGYETRLTSYSNLIPAAGTMIADESIGLVNQLTPGPLPTFLPHAKFRGNGWGFGNVPPEVD